MRLLYRFPIDHKRAMIRAGAVPERDQAAGQPGGGKATVTGGRILLEKNLATRVAFAVTVLSLTNVPFAAVDCPWNSVPPPPPGAGLFRNVPVSADAVSKNCVAPRPGYEPPVPPRLMNVPLAADELRETRWCPRIRGNHRHLRC